MTLNHRTFATPKDLLEFCNGAKAKGILRMPDPKDLTDEQVLTISDGTNPAKNFRIDLGGDGVGGGATAINVSAVAAGDRAALATAVAAAITGVHASLTIVPTAGADKVALLHDNNAASGNVAISESGGTLGFNPTGMDGGFDVIDTTTKIVNITREDGRWHLYWNS